MNAVAPAERPAAIAVIDRLAVRAEGKAVRQVELSACSREGESMVAVASCKCCCWLEALPRVSTLTTREMEVFTLLQAGESNQAIADELYITERTVRAHLAQIMRKLELTNRVHLCLASYFYFHAAPGDLVAHDNSGRCEPGPR
ncbi:helix-turn-helix transcriptional regulator [Amycolatopsis sp. NPDC004079]|uniref:helix-turn-helix domain-containing protein n=1 Tax=Amycolatopsis sp. NPDC004079 TaxID=3154549 RepID=UPI0033BFB125